MRVGGTLFNSRNWYTFTFPLTNGKKIEKYLQEKFAKRACLIEETTLAEFLNFPQMKIPFVEDKLLVLPEGRTMFNNLNSIEISHGGITVDEIVVPFIEVSK